MHTITFYLATLWLALLFLALSVRVILTKKPLARTQVVNQLALPLVAMLTLWSLYHGNSYDLDAALVLSLLAFIGTVAAAIYRGKWRFFE